MAQDLDDDIVDVQSPSTEEDDDIVSTEAPQSFLERATGKIQSAFTPSEDTIQTATGLGQTGLDFSKGVAGGLTFNAMDELGGAIGAATESGLGALGIGPAAVDEQLAAQGFKGVEQPFLEKYRDYQQGIEKDVAESEARSPIASTLGQVAGGITSGVALGGALGMGGAVQKVQSISDIARNSGKAKAALELLKRGGSNYLKAAPAIAAESALTSKEQLIGENANPAGVAADVVGGLLFGGLTMGSMELAQEVTSSISKRNPGQAIKRIFTNEDNPTLNAIENSFQKGIRNEAPPSSHRAALTGTANKSTETAETIAEELNTMRKATGSEVPAALQKATDEFKTIPVLDILDKNILDIKDLAKSFPDIETNPKVNSILNRLEIAKSDGAVTELTPIEAHDLINDLNKYYKRLNSVTVKGKAELSALSKIKHVTSQISDRLKTEVPEYKMAATRYSDLMSTYEQLLSGGISTDITKKRFSDIGSEEKVVKKLTDMIESSKKTGASAKDDIKALGTYFSRMGELEGLERTRYNRGDIKQSMFARPVSDIRKDVLEAGTESQVYDKARSLREGQGVFPNLQQYVMGKAEISLPYHTGRIIGGHGILGKGLNLGRRVYNAPAQSIGNLASKLETHSSPSIVALGKALKTALENGDTTKRNAALFTIMQNPNSRALVSSEDFPDEEPTE